MKSHVILFHPQRCSLSPRKHGGRGRSSLTPDHMQKRFPYRRSRHRNSRDGIPPRGARCSPNLFSEPCGQVSSPEEPPLQRSPCISSPAVTGDKWEGNYSHGVDCHFNRLLITPLLLMSAIVVLRCIIVPSTVLTQGKVFPCMLIAPQITVYFPLVIGWGKKTPSVNALLNFQIELW